MRNAPESIALASSRIPGNAASTWPRPWRKVIPRSSSKPRIWLMTAVRRITQRSRTRCRDCRSSWSSLLIGTKRIFGRPTASAIRLGVDVVALVCLYARLHILSRHQSYLMTLLAQSPPWKMGASAGFHANQFDLQVRREVQQLLARKLLANHNLAAQVEPNQMKDCFTKINADRV